MSRPRGFRERLFEKMLFYRVQGANYPMEEACSHSRSAPDKTPRPGGAIPSRKVQNSDLSGGPTPRHTIPLPGWASSKRRSRPFDSGETKTGEFVSFPMIFDSWTIPAREYIPECGLERGG